ncbi:MAG: glycoside hydrolase family 5 protein [Defluviitaleaceae bacterium]|nr:glycoside hydrolase family 5 protein [Defluviitaleaceae bacterium]
MEKRIFAIVMAVFLVVTLAVAVSAAQATPTEHEVRVDGTSVDVRAFNIGGRNYFMLRDVAYILRDTPVRFDLEWDGERGAILIESGNSYAGTPAEIDGSATIAVPSRADVYVNDVLINFNAYSIRGFTFFQLRELGDALGFGVDFEDGAVLIATDRNYAPAGMTPLEPLPPTELVPMPELPGDEPGDHSDDAPGEIADDEPGEYAPSPAPPVATEGFAPITAAEWVAGVRTGWNLGNHLDARTARGQTVEQMETAWTNTVVTPQMVNSVYASGINGIRIPITWQKAIDNDFNIRADWMARVHEVVGYAVANDMYIMINTHHDDEIFRLHDRYMAESRRAVTTLWTQIANEFIDYNERLVFQGFNEPRTRNSPAEWSGGTPEERRNLNELNQLFVDTVRATGGNNAQRVLIVPTYAASGTAAAINDLVVPTDTVPDRIIVSVHSYSPWLFALQIGPDSTDRWDANNSGDTNPIRSYIDRAYNAFVRNGIPVVFSETGAVNRDNNAARIAWTEFYWGHAHSRGIPAFWWDNANYGVAAQTGGGAAETFGIFNRSTGAPTHQDIIDAMIRATAAQSAE